MPLAFLVLHVAHECLFVTEAGSQFLCIGKFATAVSSDIDDESVGEGQILEDFIEIALANRTCKATIVYIADIVVEQAVFQPAGYAIVCTQISPLDGIAEIGGVILVPIPVASVVEGCSEVDVNSYNYTSLVTFIISI